MSNPRNHFHIQGNLAADPKVFTNDKGRSIELTVYVRNNYKSQNGQWESSKVVVKQFISNSKRDLTPAEKLKQGDKVVVDGSLRQEHFFDREGGEHYVMACVAENILPDESPSERAARLERTAARNAQGGYQPQPNQAPAQGYQAPAPQGQGYQAPVQQNQQPMMPPQMQQAPAQAPAQGFVPQQQNPNVPF